MRYGAVEVHPLVIATAMVKAPHVVEYQVTQTDRGVDVAVVTDGPVDLQGLADAIEGGLRKAGVVDATAGVRQVRVISRDPKTGKTRRFIPLE